MSRSSTRGALAALCTGCVLMAACGDEEPALTGAPMGAERQATRQPLGDASDAAPRIEEVVLEPDEPAPGEEIRALVTAEDPEGERLRFEYEWSVDGRLVDQGSSSSLSLGSDATRGMLVEVQVVALDPANQRSETATASVRVANSAPVIESLAFDPAGEVSAGKDLTVYPSASDPDGDEISFRYRWDVNGKTVETDGATLPASEFGTDDAIEVYVTASDGELDSAPRRSKHIEVKNAPPRIVSQPGKFDEEGRFIYKIEAEDPDGGKRFRYRLVEGPPGMELDVVDGTVRWTPREDQAGRHPVKIEVRDADGASTTQSFVVTLEFGDAETGEQSPPAAAQ